MNASIKHIVDQNPNGLLELQKSLTFSEYGNKMGFELKNICTIYESEKIHSSQKNWFMFQERPLEKLFEVKHESQGDLLVVFLIEIIKKDRIYCYLVLDDAAFRALIANKSNHLLKVHQMYAQYGERDYIALNTEMAIC